MGERAALTGLEELSGLTIGGSVRLSQNPLWATITDLPVLVAQLDAILPPDQ